MLSRCESSFQNVCRLVRLSRSGGDSFLRAISQPPALVLALRPERLPRLPAPDDARSSPSRAASSRSRTGVNPHADLIRRKGDEHEAALPRAAARRGPRGRRDRPSRSSTGSAPPATTEEAMRDGRRRRLPGRLRRRRLARARRLRRAPAGRQLRGRRHEARAARAAGARAPALLLHRAGRADPGRGARARCTSSPGSASARRFRPDDFVAYYRRLRERFLDAVANGARHLPVPGRALRRSATSSRSASSSGRTTTTSSSSPASRGTQVERLDRGRDHDARRRSATRRRTRGREASRPQTFETLRHQAELQLHQPAHRRAPRRPAAGRARSAASRSCPSRRRATSGSTSRATPGSSRRAGSSTCSAGSTSTRTASRATTASGRATAPRRSAAFERLIDFIVERRRALPGHARLPLRALRAHRAQAA